MKKSQLKEVAQLLITSGRKDLAEVMGGWFEDMSREDQAKYIKEHPDSKYARNAKREEEPKKVSPKAQEELKFDAKTSKPEDRLKSATFKDVQTTMKKNNDAIRSKKPEYKKVKGTFDPKSHLNIIADNARNNLETYTNYLAPDTVHLGNAFINMGERILRDHAKEFSKSDAETINKLFTDGINRLTHQEVESNRSPITDHGIRHIVKNIQMQQKIMDQMSDQKVTGRDRLIGMFVMLNHDMGYTSPPVRQGGMDGLMLGGEHKIYGEKIAKAQRKIWNDNKLFTPEEYNRVIDLIKTHDSPELDPAHPLTFATRIADNFALFQSEKLPSMFKYVKGGSKILLDMGQAMKKDDLKGMKALQTKLQDAIKNSDLHGNMKRDLIHATENINMKTPKFTMGVLAGSVSSIKKDKKGPMTMTIKFNKMDQFLAKHFDMGQKQAQKVLGDYGIKDFSKDTYDLGKHFRIKVEGHK